MLSRCLQTPLLGSVFIVALALPATASAVVLDLPWPCGVTYRVTQGNNESFSHSGRSAYAWDFGIGEGGVVVAPADGTVLYARGDSTRYGCSSEYINDANYVIIDLGDGRAASFAHLKAGSVRVAPGDFVRRGDPVAEVGNSGYICGTHLHFQIQQICSSPWCQSVEAEFDAVGIPVRDMRLTSNNCPAPIDCTFDGDVPHFIDETDRCFERITPHFWVRDGGHGGTHLFTWATAADAAETIGRWHFEPKKSDVYRIEISLPEGAESALAKYDLVVGEDTYGPFGIDQTAQSGWVILTDLYLEAGVPGYVALPDNTGEPYSSGAGRRIAYDAIRIIAVDDGEDIHDDDATEDEDELDAGHDAGHEGGHEGGLDAGHEPDLIEAPTRPDEPGTPGAEADDTSAQAISTNCACTSVNSGAPGPRPLLLAGFFGLLGLAFRRRWHGINRL